uniref:MLX interacting protein n=1 Tax=Poecilia formosa TaxID=48698 RepID=A0A096M3N4_POEFO
MATRETCQRQTYRRPAASIKQEQDDDSDVEETHMGLRRADGLESQIIHSGHFMVSSPHIEHPPKKGYDFDTVNKQTCKTSTSHLSIDASLTKLFECMTLAYSGKLVSPKWKNFKGLKLLWRDKIRLNNAIWRAWYMQYVEKRGNPVCHFVTPLDGNIDLDVHRPAEAIASDGKNWKRRIEIVIREYHKWRTYFKKRLQKHKDDDLSSLLKDEEAAVRRMSRRHMETPAPMEMDTLFDMDILMSEFSDTLFSTLTSHQPLGLPNPREIGNADMIQPGLIPLQPNLDFMDSFDPLQGCGTVPSSAAAPLNLRQPVLPSVSPTATSVTPQPSSSSQSQKVLKTLLKDNAAQLNHNNNFLKPSQPDLCTHIFQSTLVCLIPVLKIYDPATFRWVSAPAQLNQLDLFLTHQSTAPLNPLVPCLPGQNLPSAPAMISSPLNSGSELDETVAPSVATHTAPSPVTPSNTASTVSHVSEPPSQLQLLAPLPATPIQNPRAFALPRPFQSNSSGKVRPVPRIAPANALPSSQFILPGHANAVIVTSPPSTGVVIPPSHLGAVLPHNQKSQQPAVPEDKSCFRKNQKEPSSVDEPKILDAVSVTILKSIHFPFNSALLWIKNPSKHIVCRSNIQKAGHSQTGSSQGSPCGLDQVPSPQSIIGGSSKPLSRHISAEQKRRSNINIGFKTLGNLVPTLKSQSNITNAVTLQKTVEHIGKLQQERQQLQDEVKRLREEIEELNASISLCQEQLPATGVPMRKSRSDLMQDKFNEYVKNRTLQNWKFWV